MRLSLPLVFLSIAHYVLGNTEIVNFHASEVNDVNISLAKDWPILNPNHNELEWDIFPALLGTPVNQVCETKEPKNATCSHELWIVLDLVEAWKAYSKFTLRLSWPASFSADFSLDIYDPEKVVTHFGLEDLTTYISSRPKTRRKYGRIRVVNTGVPTPAPPSHHNPIHDRLASPPVPIILILEPLYFGVLPPTVIPVLLYLVLAIVIGALLVPIFNGYLEDVAVQVKKELNESAKHD
ncbi:hypothetical protein Hypma_016085 [Hypsizygus marmoreus]|uniref:GPI transamidase component PIG-T n=1 Tax=Hypsizygus marmoreus TaxID=39966 RepID=A0A369KEW2_HYPMA|nr:hypothetical protein Hypma_016085 [Hypsizygus marmoreus]